jgi:uncharacterized membrane protein
MTNKIYKILGGIIILVALAGLFASFKLTIEKMALDANPDHSLTCDVNAVISCSTVMKTPEAAVLGFPNTLIGISWYSIMIFVGCILVSNGELHRHLFKLIALSALGAFLFSYWLLYQSVFKIGALCPYCLVSCFASTIIGFCLAYIFAKDKGWRIARYALPIATAWYIIVAAAIIFQYKDTFFY